MTGAAIGLTTGQIWPTIFLALLSHFVLDIVPHRDDVREDGNYISKRQYKASSIDVIIASSLFVGVVVMMGLDWKIALLGSFFGIFPDLVELIALFYKPFTHVRWYKAFHDFHMWIQQVKPSWAFGLGIQLFWLALVLWYLGGLSASI